MQDREHDDIYHQGSVLMKHATYAVSYSGFLLTSCTIMESIADASPRCMKRNSNPPAHTTFRFETLPPEKSDTIVSRAGLAPKPYYRQKPHYSLPRD